LMYISCGEFREIFDAVSSGLLHYGIVPVETTGGATIADVNQFLVDSELQIIGEVTAPIHYALLALPETNPKEIRVVYSHRQALSQCQKFLSSHDLEGRPYYDEAGAAKMLLRERPKGSAAIASRFAADFYNLAVVQEGIEDNVNITRFLVFSREARDHEGNKCSIVFSTEHKAGALFRVLREFADHDINLTRIGSMPSRESPGNYIFFVDFQGSIKEPVVLRALERVQKMTPFYRFLGCYPAANNSAGCVTGES